MSNSRVLLYLATLGCVAGISVGQLMFKIAANRLQGVSLLSLEAFRALLPALLLYGLTTIAWVAVLRELPLSSAYPLMALAFVFVPLGSVLFLNETISLQYWGGVRIIGGRVAPDRPKPLRGIIRSRTLWEFEGPEHVLHLDAALAPASRHRDSLLSGTLSHPRCAPRNWGYGRRHILH